MKIARFLTSLLLLFLLIITDVQAQGPIYLPLIFGNGELTMSGLATLEITDGTTTINLLTKEGQTGFHLVSWRPQIIQPKDGGVYQDSEIAPGRDLVFAVDGTANEIFNTHLAGKGQNELIQTAQDLLRLLTKARNYSLSEWQDTPVYIKAQASCEDSPRYALIKNYQIQDVDNPYGQAFNPTASQLVAMQNIAIGIEHGHWCGSLIGTGACAEINSVQDWEYNPAWSILSATPTGDVLSLFQSTTGRIFAGDNNQILYSDDNGANWFVSVVTAGTALCFLQTPTGRIFAGVPSEIWYSDDDGTNWFVSTLLPTVTVYSLLQTTTGRILAGDSGQILYSDDNGNTWNILVAISPDNAYTIIQSSTGRILVKTQNGLLASDNNGNTWYIISSYPITYGNLIQTSTGRLLVGGNAVVYASDDDGSTWYIIASVATLNALSLLQVANGNIYIGSIFGIWRSSDDGYTWVNVASVAVSFNCLLQITTGRILSGDDGDIYSYLKELSQMGMSQDCDDNTFVSNKQNIANLTHIFIYDGGVFSANLFPLALPTTLLPAVPAVNDAIYFGIDTSIDNSGPFTSLVFDIAIPARSTTSYTITWEYSNGAAGWPALTVQDGTNAGIGALSNLGVNSVHWTPPATFAPEAVNGVTSYWVRARVSALVGTLTPPTQQNRNIYSVVNSYTEIASTEVLGDIPALAQILAHNRSDQDGPGGNAPNLYANRLIVGLRSYNRGPAFQAYLNAADEQNPLGIAVSVGTNTTIGNDINAPTGRSATYNPGGVEAMATRVTFAFGPTIARDYYGSFHAFLRVYRDAGASTDFTVRLQVVNGSGGVSYTTDTQQVQTTTRLEVLDFGLIRIPAAGSLGLDELGDTSEIRVQASAASGVPNLVIYDLILIPTDEWAIDSNDKTNSSYSDIGRSSSYDKVLNIDSITKPKYPIRSVVQRYGSNLVTSIYNSVTPGEAILQANVQQRLWFFSMRTSATGTSYSWIAPPEISYSLQIFANSRYLSLRGDR